MRAKALVISYADTHSALRILHHVHELRPGMPVVVRTLDDTDIDALKQAGAAEVVPEIMEGSLMLASHALMLVGVPFNRVLRRIRQTREQRYGLFRGFFRGVTDETGEERDRTQPRLHSVRITPGARAQGRSLRDIDLGALGVEVTAVRRRRVRSVAPDPDTVLAEGDVVVLRGTEEELALAEIRLMQGASYTKTQVAPHGRRQIRDGRLRAGFCPRLCAFASSSLCRRVAAPQSERRDSTASAASVVVQEVSLPPHSGADPPTA